MHNRKLGFYFKSHVFEHNVWFVFLLCIYVGSLQNQAKYFDAIFIQDKSKKLSSLICKLFCDKDICQIICQNNEIAIILVYLNIFFNKFNFKQLGKWIVSA